jgi:DNA-binding transcriptional regulator GbsR (MarR family)
LENDLDKIRDNLIQELGRISSFAGFNKATGQIYALLYLSMKPVSLGEIAEQLGISKGNASLNIRSMERWGLIQPISKTGDRRDYYQAETDFWKIARGILNERDKKEMDHLINAIAGMIESLSSTEKDDTDTESSFYREKLGHMLDFGNAINHMVQAFLTFDNLRINSLMKSGPEKSQSHRIDVEG